MRMKRSTEPHAKLEQSTRFTQDKDEKGQKRCKEQEDMDLDDDDQKFQKLGQQFSLRGGGGS